MAPKNTLTQPRKTTTHAPKTTTFPTACNVIRWEILSETARERAEGRIEA